MRDYTTRILIADGHVLFREALRQCLDQEPDLLVVATTGLATDIPGMAKQHCADVLVLDPETVDGWDTTANDSVREFAHLVKVVLLTQEIARRDGVRAIRHGIRGIVLKTMDKRLILKCIRDVQAGEIWISRDLLSELIIGFHSGMPRKEVPRGAPSAMTAREMQIVEAIAEGCTNRDIAARLSLSEQTVKHHLTRIFAKRGVSNRVELALLFRKKLIPGLCGSRDQRETCVAGNHRKGSVL